MKFLSAKVYFGSTNCTLVTGVKPIYSCMERPERPCLPGRAGRDAPAANGQTGRAVGPTTAAAAVHAVVEPRMPLTPDEVKNTMAFKILAQFKTPKDIR